MPLAQTGMWPKHRVILQLLEKKKVPGGYLTTAGGQILSPKSQSGKSLTATRLTTAK